MKATKENKERYVAAHWGQEVVVVVGSDNGRITPKAIFKHGGMVFDHSYLELTSLQDITDEHAIEVANIAGEENYPIGTRGKLEAGRDISRWFDDPDTKDGYENYIHPCRWIKIIDYLRSKSYAIPFDGSPVEDLIEYRYLKIKGR